MKIFRCNGFITMVAGLSVGILLALPASAGPSGPGQTPTGGGGSTAPLKKCASDGFVCTIPNFVENPVDFGGVNSFGFTEKTAPPGVNQMTWLNSPQGQCAKCYNQDMKKVLCMGAGERNQCMDGSNSTICFLNAYKNTTGWAWEAGTAFDECMKVIR